MNLGTKGLDLIKSFEGCILYAYDDLTGKRVNAGGTCTGTLTIGYGHTGSDVKKGMTITQAQAEAFLKKDLATFATAVNKYVSSHKLNQNQFDALVSFSFNCGTGALAKVMASKDVTGTMALYVKSNGVVLKGLQRRREAEIKLYKTGATPPKPVDPTPTNYYKKCSASQKSIVDGLNEIGVNSSFANRQKIAKANGITNYSGTADQNSKMLTLLKNGKLKKA